MKRPARFSTLWAWIGACPVKYKVKVLRTSLGEIEVEVEASNEIEAMAKAVDKAKNSEISSYRSDYDIVGVFPQHKED